MKNQNPGKMSSSGRTGNMIMAVLILLSLSSCFSAKTDKLIGRYYGNQLPVPDKKKKNSITVINSEHDNIPVISTTTHKTVHVLPILLYWQFEYQRNSLLNSQIPVTFISDVIYAYSNKKLIDKIADKQLELTIEQTPVSFSFIDKSHLVIPVVSWDFIYLHPDKNDLVISYRLLNHAVTEKTGRIMVKSRFNNEGIRYFESLRKALNNYLGDFEANLKIMSKEMMNKLADEL
jgi:hypothetical protein